MRSGKGEPMKCPYCKSLLKKVKVSIEGTSQDVISFQCQKCDFVEFERETAHRAILDLKVQEMPLKIKQRIIKLSKDRLGTYFNSNIIRSLNLKSGEDIYVSVPDKKHIIISLEER